MERNRLPRNLRDKKARQTMKVLAWVHLYPPDHCAGAEMMLHEILLGLQARGHEVRVYCDSSSTQAHDGIPVASATAGPPDVAWADVVVTHLDRTRQVVETLAGSKPIVHLVHNDRQLKFHGVKPQDAALVVANSEWIRKAIDWPGPVVVIPPPVDPKRYKTQRHNARYVTLVNLSEPKGSTLFWRLAWAMPERRFMGVIGGYGKQDVPRRIPANTVVLPHSPDIVTVYRQTRLLLAPSSYESWGRVGIEAAASGIPTIAHPTPGLMESLGASGTFVDRNDTDGWIMAIRDLDDDALYGRKAFEASARSAELEPTVHLHRLEEAMLASIRQFGSA